MLWYSWMFWKRSLIHFKPANVLIEALYFNLQVKNSTYNLSQKSHKFNIHCRPNKKGKFKPSTHRITVCTAFQCLYTHIQSLCANSQRTRKGIHYYYIHSRRAVQCRLSKIQQLVKIIIIKQLGNPLYREQPTTTMHVYERVYLTLLQHVKRSFARCCTNLQKK